MSLKTHHWRARSDLLAYSSRMVSRALTPPAQTGKI
jgi:hypothetical protein